MSLVNPEPTTPSDLAGLNAVYVTNTEARLQLLLETETWVRITDAQRPTYVSVPQRLKKGEGHVVVMVFPQHISPFDVLGQLSLPASHPIHSYIFQVFTPGTPPAIGPLLNQTFGSDADIGSLFGDRAVDILALKSTARKFRTAIDDVQYLKRMFEMEVVESKARGRVLSQGKRSGKALHVQGERLLNWLEKAKSRLSETLPLLETKEDAVHMRFEEMSVKAREWLAAAEEFCAEHGVADEDGTDDEGSVGSLSDID